MKTTQKHTQLFALSALTSFTLLLSACGGGGSTPAPAPNLPVISQAAATDAVSFAKSGNALVINHLVSNSDLEGSLLAVMTGATYTYPTPTPIASSNCGVSGTTSYVFLKTKSGAGLNVGDYIESIYANCVQVAGGVAFNGTSRDTALTNTTADVSAAGATFALPFTWTATNYHQLSTTLTSTFNGVVNFTTYSYNPNGARSIVANTNATGLTVNSVFSGGNLTNSYKNLIATIGSVAAGTTTANLNYDFSNTTSGTTLTQHNVSATTAPGPYSSNYSLATYTVTNVNGQAGTMVGTKSGSNVSITVDYGSNGTIDNTFSVADSAI